MNCNCLDRVKEELKTKLPENNAKYAGMKVISVQFEGEAFVYDGDKMVDGLSIPANISHEPIGRKKMTAINVIASHCPFCGELCAGEAMEDAE